MSGMRGKCVNIIHTFKDSLWGLGDVSIIPPVIQIEKPDVSRKQEDTTTGNMDEVQHDPETVKEAEEKACEDKIPTNEPIDNLASQMSSLKMTDEFLRTVFLVAIKFKSKEYQLPVIVSTFMKIMQNCW